MRVTPKALAHVVCRTRRFAFLDRNDYICGPAFEANPVGVEFDPEEWRASVRDRAALADFRTRTIHKRGSPISGETSALL